MKRKINIFLKYLFLFHFGGGTYTTIELLYRNETYIQMYILGGVCFLICGLLNKCYGWEMGIIKQVLIGGAAVTLLEFVTGMIFNVWLEMNMWSYENLPFNLCGQIAPQFIVVWLLLALLAIVLDDVIRYRFFYEERPRYWIGNKCFEIKFKEDV